MDNDGRLLTLVWLDASDKRDKVRPMASQGNPLARASNPTSPHRNGQYSLNTGIPIYLLHCKLLAL